MLFAEQIFNVGSVPSAQEMLFTMAEYVSGTITTTSVDTQQSIFQAIQQTLMNMIDIINAYQIQTLMAQEYSLLSRVSGILPNLSVSDQTLINNRLNSFNSLTTSIYNLPISMTFNVNNLNSGQAALPAYDLLGYFLEFDFETIPTGTDINNFVSQSLAMATAWQDAVNYLANNGTSFQVTAYDPTDRMYSCSQDIYNFLTNLTFATSAFSSASNALLTQLWNSLVALPSLLRVSGLLLNDPSSQISQSINSIKYTIFNLLYQTNFILALFESVIGVQQPATGVLRAGESLLDFSARTTGNYANWTTIASINNLMPPYVGIVAASNIAIPGQQLYLPPIATSQPFPNYELQFLGTDIDLGQPGSTLTLWNGDFNLISGLNNYISALLRRVLTPVGSLIYHTSYGSVLPSEVGSITSASEVGFMANDLRVALASDPRTQLVNSISAYPKAFGEIILTASVTPYGTSTAAPINFLIRTANSVT